MGVQFSARRHRRFVGAALKEPGLNSQRWKFGPTRNMPPMGSESIHVELASRIDFPDCISSAIESSGMSGIRWAAFFTIGQICPGQSTRLSRLAARSKLVSNACSQPFAALRSGSVDFAIFPFKEYYRHG